MSIDNGMMKLLAKLGLLLMITASAQAASFDCAKAGTKVEHMICDNPELSKLDEELAQNYKIALQDQSKAKQVKKSQRHWMKERDVCQSETCLKNSYRSRIAGLTITLGGMPAQAGAAPEPDARYAGEYVLRASVKQYKGFCTAFNANLNEYRSIDFNTCDARLSPKYPQFSRPQWEEIPLDLDMVKKVVGSPPGMRWEYWSKATEAARAAKEVKLWRTQVDLLNDGNLDTLVRLDHYQDTVKPYCSYIESRQIITDMPNPEVSKRYDYGRYKNTDRLGGDMIYDAGTKRYFVLNWNRYSGVGGDGISFSNIGATASVKASVADSRSIWPVCWIDWVATGHRNSIKDSIDTHQRADID